MRMVFQALSVQRIQPFAFSGPEKEPPTFADAMKITPAFAELLAMQFGIPESTKVMNLIAEKRLWVICIKMKQLEYDNVFGYYSHVRQSNRQSAGCSDIFYNDDLFCFVVKGPHLDDIINEFRVSMDNTPPFPFAGFFGEHFDKPVVQYGDDTPKERRPEIRPGTNLAFRNDNYYIVFLGYAAIAEYKSEMVGCEQGNYFDAHIKVTPISKQEKNKFIGFLELPSHIARFKVDFVISLRFQEEATVNRAPRVADPHVEPKRDVSTTPKNMDVWLGRVVDHLPDAPNDTTSDVFLVSLGKKYDIVMNLHHILHLTSFQKKSSDCDH
ncbi:hypothetical protein VN97_g4345 [Penicillium thymicola]|uniref:Uncharacterized protein n=1 Tax=Penicillium thymicola TaxID=293382 RepID=A0AAI9TKT6_PENTH|nr:hypothetical protein VN97_g4345 [Penicillium thymicola]